LKNHFSAMQETLDLHPEIPWAVDDLHLSFGREAISKALIAAHRAEHFHTLALDEKDRLDRLRSALQDAIDASRRITAEVNISPIARASGDWLELVNRLLESLPESIPSRRGSPGRVVHSAAAEAVAQVWARARARRIPRSGKVAPQHELAVLLRAISADIFGAPGRLSVSLLRTPKK